MEDLASVLNVAIVTGGAVNIKPDEIQLNSKIVNGPEPEEMVSVRFCRRNEAIKHRDVLLNGAFTEGERQKEDDGRCGGL